MEPTFIDRTALGLQLLAINVLFDQARAGTSAQSSTQAIQEMLKLGEKIQANPGAVRVRELDDAQASILYHALLA